MPPVAKQASFWFGEGASQDSRIEKSSGPKEPSLPPHDPGSVKEGDEVIICSLNREGYQHWSGCRGRVIFDLGDDPLYVRVEKCNAIIPVRRCKLSRDLKPATNTICKPYEVSSKQLNTNATSYPSTPHLPFSPQVFSCFDLSPPPTLFGHELSSRPTQMVSLK